METDEAPSDVPPPSSEEADVNMQDAKSNDAPSAENGVPESGDKPELMETDAKVSSQMWVCYVLTMLLFHMIQFFPYKKDAFLGMSFGLR